MAKVAVIHKKVHSARFTRIGERLTRCGIWSRNVRKFWPDVTGKRCRARKGK